MNLNLTGSEELFEFRLALLVNTTTACSPSSYILNLLAPVKASRLQKTRASEVAAVTNTLNKKFLGRGCVQVLPQPLWRSGLV